MSRFGMVFYNSDVMTPGKDNKLPYKMLAGSVQPFFSFIADVTDTARQTKYNNKYVNAKIEF